MVDLSDLFGAPPPRRDQPPAAPVRKPWVFDHLDSAMRPIQVLPLRRMGDRTEVDGELVILAIVGPPGLHHPDARIRAPLHGGPAWRTRIEDPDAVASCDAAPHVTDLLSAGDTSASVC